MTWSGAAAALGALLLTACAGFGDRTVAPAPQVAAKPGDAVVVAIAGEAPVGAAANNPAPPAPGAAGAGPGLAVVTLPAAATAPEAAASAADPAAEQRLPTLGVIIEIDAPGNLRTLLERNLDLVRLGKFERGDIDDSEWSRLIDATPSQVRELLQTEGYFDPQVQLERVPRRAAGEPDIVRLAVVPGARARIGRLTLEAEGELERGAAAGDGHAQTALDALRRGWPLTVGTEFRNPTWSDAKAAALARLRAAGYATANWSGTAAEVDVPRNEVRLFLVVDSGPLFRFGQLEVEGLARQEVETVQNLAGVEPGTPITETLLLDFQERLQTAGLFESVTVTLNPDPAQAATSTIQVRLREAPLQVYTFGVGVSANTGPRASVEHIYRRVFGFPLTARNKAEWGDKRQAWDGELSTHPGEGQYRNLLGGAVERLETGDESVLSQRIRLGRTTDTARIERLYFLEAERSLRRTPSTRTDAIAFSYNYHGVWRRLDSPVLPTEGFSFAGQASVGRSHGSNAESGVFARGYGRLTAYLPLGRNWYGQARLEVGQVFGKENVAVPETQLFRAGGDDSVRGYSFRSLGPQVNGEVSSGRVMLTSSVEVARPISESLPFLWGAVFVDIGNAANSFKNIEYVLGTGVGLRWRSPVGPLRLDWAWGRETRKGRLHFSVGIAF
jgi:translocation and assembly module TamA